MRTLPTLGLAVVFMLAGASAARADHTHVLILPNGNCAILAANGNEKYRVLPEVLFSNNPNVDADDVAGGLESLPLNRRHPLHVLVHLGVPGADGDIAVMGSPQDPCAAAGNYVNG
jgi:3-deoxy-D-arabino-heptulosonate 7-phosphate (DAHP) synthase